MSDRVMGRYASSKINVPLSDSNPNVTGFDVLGTYADGRTFGGSFSNVTNQVFSFTWDHKNSLNQLIPTSTDLTLVVTYYAHGKGIPVTYYGKLGGFKAETFGIGGWSPNLVHHYEFAKQMLKLGAGGIHRTEAVPDSTNFRVLSPRGDEVYIFDSKGKHLSTLYGLTGETKYSFTYDSSSGALSSITDAFGQVTSFNVNSVSGMVDSITSPKGLVTNLTYDSNGFLASVTNPNNETYSMTYDSAGLMLTFEKPEGETNTFTYETNGALISDEHSGGYGISLSSTDILENGYPYKLITSVTTLGRTTTRKVNNTYQSLGQGAVYSVKNGELTDIRYEIGSRQENHETYVLSESYKIDPRFGTSYRYKGKARLSIEGKSTSTEYYRSAVLSDPDEIFNPLSMTYTTKIGSNVFTEEYNGVTKRWEKTTPEGRKSYRQIDQYERVVETQTGDLLPVEYSYGIDGKIIRARQGDRITHLNYDSRGFLSQIIDPLGRVAQYIRDNNGRTLIQIDPGSRQTHYQYDANGRMISLTTPTGQVHQFSYNGHELLAEYTPPSLGPSVWNTNYNYSDDKELTLVTLPDGREIKYSYYSNGKLQMKGYEDEGYTWFNYEGGSRYVTSISNSFLTLKKTYFGPYIASEEQAHNDSRDTIAKVLFSFDDQFRHSRISIQDSAGNYSYTPNFFYDRDGLLKQAGDLSIFRNSIGQASELKLGKAQSLYSYDPQYGEPSQIEYRYNGKKGFIQDFKRDALGRISEMYNESGRNQLHYDISGRFTGRSQQGSTKPYSQFIYDKNGNRIRGYEDNRTFTASYDNQDRLIKYNNTTYSYNENGDRESESTDSETTTYSYNVHGDLIHVQLPNKSISYHVDGHNRRVAKVVNEDVVTRYIWLDQLRIGAELNADGTLRKTFVYANGVNSPEYMVYQGKRYFFVKDHRGSVNLVVDIATGEVKQKIVYSEFGEVLQDTNPGFQPFGFAGGLYDPDTKLVRFGARDYDGRTGRWLSKDPIGFEGADTNLYGYVLNDPINFIDPQGLQSAGQIGYVIIRVGLNGLFAELVGFCAVFPDVCFPKPKPPEPPKPTCNPQYQSCPVEPINKCGEF